MTVSRRGRPAGGRASAGVGRPLSAAAKPPSGPAGGGPRPRRSRGCPRRAALAVTRTHGHHGRRPRSQSGAERTGRGGSAPDARPPPPRSRGEGSAAAAKGELLKGPRPFRAPPPRVGVACPGRRCPAGAAGSSARQRGGGAAAWGRWAGEEEREAICRRGRLRSDR